MEILDDDKYNYDNQYSEDESKIYDKINKQYLKSLSFEELINQDIKIKTIRGRFEEIKIDEPVDIIKHKDNFDHFCNFIIFENGEIYYAIPSHILSMINYCKKNNIEFEKDKDPMIFTRKILDKLKCIVVHEKYFFGKPNKNQISILSTLKNCEIYKGSLEGIEY